jgi:long-subunit acyl-CoA synthetase (AMP-forming)
MIAGLFNHVLQFKRIRFIRIFVVLIEKISDLRERLNLPNVDKLDFRIAISMNTKYMVIVAAMAVMLVGATAFATDSAFADKKKHYGKNQAVSQANACGNGELPLNVFCQNIGSQVQGDENAVSAAGSQGQVPE